MVKCRKMCYIKTKICDILGEEWITAKMIMKEDTV